jgi:hypothetical protein
MRCTFSSEPNEFSSGGAECLWMRDVKKRPELQKERNIFSQDSIRKDFVLRNEEKTSGGSNYKHLVPPELTAYQFLSLIDTRPESGRITLPENVQDWHYMVRTGSRLIFMSNPDRRVSALIRG